MTEHTFVVMLQIKTSDPRLSEQALSRSLGSAHAGEFAKIRHALLQRLPKDVERMIAVFPPEHAKMLMMLHELHGEDIAKFLRDQGIKAEAPFVRPPSDYVPPTRD